MTVEIAARVCAVVVGAIAAAWFLASAVRTMVIPRPERVWITTTAFRIARRIAHWRARRSSSPATRHRILGSFAPIVLICLPVIWSIGVIVSFSGIYWGIIGGSWLDAVELSGSSLTTLGFTQAPTFLTRMIAIVEALLGLALVAFVISFLPTLYTTFSHREIAVGELTIRAGEPPTPTEFLTRLHLIGRLDQVGARWEEWEEWFVELAETHTSFPALIYFRSARADRSWLAAAETALDTASFITCTHILPRTGQAETMIRSGYLALRSIADFYGIEPEGAPRDRNQVSISRQQFDALWARIEHGGVSIDVDRDDAWEHFVGWRVNYDNALTGLQALVGDVRSHWDDLEVPRV